MSKYCTLQSIEFGHKFITPFDPETDTPESIVKMSDGKVAYRFLEVYDTIPKHKSPSMAEATNSNQTRLINPHD